jgi:hypothetical protein
MDGCGCRTSQLCAGNSLIVGVSVSLPVVRQMPSAISSPLCSVPFKAESHVETSISPRSRPHGRSGRPPSGATARVTGLFRGVSALWCPSERDIHGDGGKCQPWRAAWPGSGARNVGASPARVESRNHHRLVAVLPNVRLSPPGLSPSGALCFFGGHLGCGSFVEAARRLGPCHLPDADTLCSDLGWFGAPASNGLRSAASHLDVR